MRSTIIAKNTLINSCKIAMYYMWIITPSCHKKLLPP